MTCPFICTTCNPRADDALPRPPGSASALRAEGPMDDRYTHHSDRIGSVIDGGCVLLAVSIFIPPFGLIVLLLMAVQHGYASLATRAERRKQEREIALDL